MRFRKFLTEQNIGDIKKPESKSIQHLEDMDIDAFLEAMKNISNLSVTDKLDGTALTVGKDIAGNFYTTRAGKGSPKKFYNSQDYSKTGAGTIFGLAHAVLESQKDIINSILNPGEAVDIEILYGKQPNAVIYGADKMNYIGFLKTTRGDGSEVLDHLKPQLLSSALEDINPKVQYKMMQSLDGENIIYQPIISEWHFITPRVIDSQELGTISLTDEIHSLETYLGQIDELSVKYGYLFTNRDLVNTSSKNFQPEYRDELKAQKQHVQDTIDYTYKAPIKNKILNEFVRLYKSPLRDISSTDDFGIEGLVFFNSETGEQFKVVDREVFSEINKFNYAIRRKIRGSIMTIDLDSKLESRGGIYGNALIRIMTLFGIDGLILPRNIKKVLIKYKGKNGFETVNNLADTLVQNNFDGMKRKSIAIVDNTLLELQEGLDDFKKNKNTTSMNLSNGKTIKYTDTIIDRTLLSFAETRRDLLKLRDGFMNCDNIQEYIILLLGNKIKQIHGVEM